MRTSSYKTQLLSVLSLALLWLGFGGCPDPETQRTDSGTEIPSGQVDSGVIGYSVDGETIVLFDSEAGTAFYMKPGLTVGVSDQGDLVRFFLDEGTVVDVRPVGDAPGVEAIFELSSPNVQGTAVYRVSTTDGGQLEELSSNPLTSKLRSVAQPSTESCISAFIEGTSEGLSCAQEKTESLYQRFLLKVGEIMPEVSGLVPTVWAQEGWNTVSEFFRNENNVADGVLIRPESMRPPSQQVLDRLSSLDVAGLVQTYRAAFRTVKPGDDPRADSVVRTGAQIFEDMLARLEAEDRPEPTPPSPPPVIPAGPGISENDIDGFWIGEFQGDPATIEFKDGTQIFHSRSASNGLRECTYRATGDGASTIEESECFPFGCSTPCEASQQISRGENGVYLRVSQGQTQEMVVEGDNLTFYFNGSVVGVFARCIVFEEDEPCRQRVCTTDVGCCSNWDFSCQDLAAVLCEQIDDRCR